MKTVEMTVVGLQYRVTPHTLRQIKKSLDGAPLKVVLEREPENTHDENAIKVVVAEPPCKGMHIGFISRITAAVIAPALDSGKISDVHAWLVDVDDDFTTGQMSVRFKTENPRKTQAKKKSTKKT